MVPAQGIECLVIHELILVLSLLLFVLSTLDSYHKRRRTHPTSGSSLFLHNHNNDYKLYRIVVLVGSSGFSSVQTERPLRCPSQQGGRRGSEWATVNSVPSIYPVSWTLVVYTPPKKNQPLIHRNPARTVRTRDNILWGTSIQDQIVMLVTDS